MKKYLIKILIIIVISVIFGHYCVNAVENNNQKYKGTINTDLSEINVIQNAKGDNYISGKIDIAEWIENVCKTPSTVPSIVLKSTDGEFQKQGYIKYLQGIKYYFDVNIEKLDISKEYYIEVKLTNPNNTATEEEQTQRAKIRQKGKIGECTNKNIVTIKENNIIAIIGSTQKYKGTINTDLSEINVIQNAKGDNYISGKIDIAEWIENVCKTPSTVPSIVLKSTDGEFQKQGYIKYLQGIKYYFDVNIEKLDISKEYYIEVKLTNPNNTATEEEQTQRAKIRQKGKIGKCTNNIIVKIENSVIKLEEESENTNPPTPQVITLDTTKYPGYKERLDQLLEEHPNWSFTFLYTGIKFSDAVSGEYSVRKRNLVPTSYGGEWICGTTLYDTGWYGASEKAIAYYMDPRNFLDNINIFQFQDVNEYIAEACTIEGITSKVSGSFLAGYENDMNNACLNTNVNPYYIIARLIQEQGYKGGSTVKMKDGDKYYYNPFNIGASGDSTAEVIANALARAKSEGWDTMQKALEGGIHFCKVNWLDNYQNTLYQNRFDIDSTNGTSLYSHQYMQNLMGAYSEAKTLYSMYKNTNKLDSHFTFIIPLYDNMDTELSPMPSNTTESYPINVKTTGTFINLRSDANTSSSVIKVIEEKGTVLLSVQRGINSNWNKVVLQDGTIGYISGTYLTQIDDVKTCNYKAKVKTNDGDGCKIRVGPGLKLDMITVLSDDTQLTVIDDTTYKGIDGYDWYRVVQSNGNQGFMPGKYLTKIN